MDGLYYIKPDNLWVGARIGFYSDTTRDPVFGLSSLTSWRTSCHLTCGSESQQSWPSRNEGSLRSFWTKRGLRRCSKSSLMIPRTRDSSLMSLWMFWWMCSTSVFTNDLYAWRGSSLMSLQTLLLLGWFQLQYGLYAWGGNSLTSFQTFGGIDFDLRDGQSCVVFLGFWPRESHDLVILTRHPTRGTCPSCLLASSSEQNFFALTPRVD